MSSELELTGEFMNQFGGSAAANLVTVAVLGVLVLLKKCCDRPSKCKSHFHCPCLDVEVVDRSQTLPRSVPKNKAETGPGFV
jgi:hypothetical protein